VATSTSSPSSPLATTQTPVLAGIEPIGIPGTPIPTPVESAEPPAGDPQHLEVKGWLFVPSPSAVRQNGTGLHACGGADPNEVERSWASGIALNFSRSKNGPNIVSSVRTSTETQLVYLRVEGQLTCGWQARFSAQLPSTTSPFFMRYKHTSAYWGPLTRRAAKGWTFTFIHA
jgi:hypothetical protein